MILIKSFLAGFCMIVSNIYACLNEGDKVRECYNCWKIMTQAHLHVGFFRTFFIELASLK